MDDLIEFLQARLNEDQTAAEGASNKGHAEWHTVFGQTGDYEVEDDAGRPVTGELVEWTSQAVHIARHDPARELAEVAAKRAVVERHSSSDFQYVGDDGGGVSEYAGEPTCDYCNRPWPCPDLLDVGLPFASHPDYREEWRP